MLHLYICFDPLSVSATDQGKEDILERRRDSLSTEGFNGAGGQKRRVREDPEEKRREEKRREETFFGVDCDHSVGTKDLKSVLGLGG